MKKNNILLISIILVFILIIIPINANDLIPNHIEINNKGYVENTNYYIKVDPQHKIGSGYVYFDLVSYLNTDDYVVAFGFNTNRTIPKSAELKVDIPSNKTYEIEKEYLKSTISTLNPTSGICNTGNDAYNTNKIEITYTNGSKEILCYNSYTENSTLYSVKYTDYEALPYSWQDISSMFTGLDYDFNNKNKWYYINDVTLEKNRLYQLRIDLEVLDNGKFDFLYYPSIYNNIRDAFEDNKVNYIDPTYNLTGLANHYRLDTNGIDDVGGITATAFNITYNSSGYYNYSAIFNGTAYFQMSADNFEYTNATFNLWYNAFNATNMTWLIHTGVISIGLNVNDSTGTFTNGSLSFNAYNGSIWNTVQSPNNTYNDKQWHMVTGSYQSNGFIKLYIDGNPIKNISFVNLDKTQSRTTRIGDYYTTGLAYGKMKGQIDDLLMWNRQLSDQEVLNLYNSYLTPPTVFYIPNLTLNTNTRYQTYETLIGNCTALNTSVSTTPNTYFEYLWYKNGVLFKNDTSNNNTYLMNQSINAYNLTKAEYLPNDTIIISCRAKSLLYGNSTLVYTNYTNSSQFIANNTFYTTSNKFYYQLKDLNSSNITFNIDSNCINISCNNNTNCTALIGTSNASYCYNISSVSIDNKILYEGSSNLNCYVDFNIGDMDPITINNYWYNNTDNLLKSSSNSCEQSQVCTVDTILASEIGTNNGIYCQAKVLNYSDSFFYLTGNDSSFISQKAYKGSIGDCGVTRPYRIFDIKYYDEITRLPINATNTYSLNFYDGIDTVNLNGTFPINSTNSICTSINTSNQSISWSITGDYIISKTDYISRVISRSSGNKIYTNNSNATIESIYLIGVDNSSTITFTWRTPFYQYINGQMLIYSCDANNTKSLIDTVNINSGTAVSNLQLLSQSYYYQVLYDGKIIEDTETYSKCHIESKIDATYLVDIFTIDLNPVLGLYLVDCGVEKISNNTVKMQWSVNSYDTSDIYACIVGKRIMPSGAIEIYRNCSTGSYGSFIRSIPSNSYSYYVYGEITQNGNTKNCKNEVQFITQNNVSKSFGLDGILAIVFIIISTLLMFSDSGINQLLGIGVGIAVVYILGILSFPINSIIGIIVFLVIIGIVGRLSRKN